MMLNKDQLKKLLEQTKGQSIQTILYLNLEDNYDIQENLIRSTFGKWTNPSYVPFYYMESAQDMLIIIDNPIDFNKDYDKKFRWVTRQGTKTQTVDEFTGMPIDENDWTITKWIGPVKLQKILDTLF